MRGLTGRLNYLILAVIVLCAVGIGTSTAYFEHLRSELRVQAAEQSQLYGFLRLSSEINGLHHRYSRHFTDTQGSVDVDVGQLRRDLNELLLTLRAEIERSEIFPESSEANADEADKLTELTAEVSTFLSHLETAEGMFKAGRTTEAQAFFTDAMELDLTQHINPLIEEAATRERTETIAMRGRIEASIQQLTWMIPALYLAIALVAAAGFLFISLPLSQGLNAIRQYMEKVALGDAEAAYAGPNTVEYSSLNAAVDQMAATHRRLGDDNQKLRAMIEQRTDQLKSEKDELRQLDQSRRDFLADTSHELRSPLTVMRGVAEVALRTGGGLEEMRAALARIVDEVTHISRIVDDLFFIARSQAGILDLRTDQVDLMDLADAAHKDAAAIAQTTSGTLDWTMPDALAELEGDKGRLRQLMTIVIDNAFKYGGPSPHVEVSHHITDKAVTITIRDHGSGIPAADLPQVFERLYRGSQSNGRKPGAGLGLSLARSIVDGHRGTITMANASDGGAVVTIELPLFDSEP